MKILTTFLYSKSHNANHLLAKITRCQTVCLALRYHPFTHKHGIKIPHMWYCACQENAVTLHSEIRDVHQSQIDSYYLFVRGSTQKANIKQIYKQTKIKERNKTMAIAKSLTELVGNTPLLELNKFSKAKGLDTPVIVKVEYFNPGGSVKDRIALAMVEDAEKKGLLKPGATIIEPTSGNTGVGLALVSAVKGYHLILTMPETMSVERRNLVKAYGAEVRLTSGKDGMKGAIKAAEELRDSIPGSIILQQFENEANPAKHYATTGPEIWNQTDGKVDIFVAGVGTGGTVSGVAKYLKEQNPNVKVYAVEPSTSAVLNGKPSGAHKIQGIGAGFIPKTYSSDFIDEVIDVDNDDAIRTGRELAQQEGLLVGISSGAAAFAAAQLAQRPENKGKKIVALLPDTGERYLSTVLYAFDEYPL